MASTGVTRPGPGAPPRLRARIAGALYLLSGAAAAFAMIVVGKLSVDGAAAATAQHLLAREGLYRLGVASEILSNPLFVAVKLVFAAHS